MNKQRFILDELDVEVDLLGEVLRCILHTIMFQRAFGLVRPVDAQFELIELVYAKCEEPEIERAVEQNVATLTETARKKGLKRLQVVVTFYDKRKEKSWFSSEKRNPWEEWVLSFKLASERVSISEDRKLKLEEDVRGRIFAILRSVSDNRSHIPPLTSKEILPFPFEVQYANQEAGSGLDMLWSMIKSPAPNLN